MRSTFLRAALITGLVAFPASSLFHDAGGLHAQQRSERLILKDGSYQSVTKFARQGDRVHYMSAERFEWEDLPASLVDWDATNKYNSDLISGKMPTKIVETPEEKEEREKEEANSPEIAPGVSLPGSGGVFLFDQFQGKPELAEIVQNGSEVNKNAKKKSVLRSAINPESGKQAFEIKGEHAQIQSHVGRPAIYIDIDEGPQNVGALNERFRLVRAVVKKDSRVVGNVKVSLKGKATQQNSFIPATVSKLGTGEWIKLTPDRDLAAGEYAVVEMLNPDEMNLFVWDFGVNPGAPVNPNTWQATPAKPAGSAK